MTGSNLQDTQHAQACSTQPLSRQAYDSLQLHERLSAPSALDYNGPCHNVVHSPVVLEEEEGDEDGKEEGDGEVLIQCPHCRAKTVRTKRQNKTLD